MIEITSALPSSERNAQGFGSSDKTHPQQLDQSQPKSTSVPILPPKAPDKYLVNQRKNWPHSRNKITGHTDTFDPFCH